MCRRAGVPMVFDAHHHVVHEGLDCYDHPSVAEMVEAARTTWPVPEWQLVHISNGRSPSATATTATSSTSMPAAYRRVPWIEVEAKHKELAIERLTAEWLIDVTCVLMNARSVGQYVRSMKSAYRTHHDFSLTGAAPAGAAVVGRRAQA